MEEKQVISISGRKPSVCDCSVCRNMCRTPGLATPQEIMTLIEKGYEKRLQTTIWGVGMLLGITDKPIGMVQPRIVNGWCTFRKKNGLCELHDLGLKPTECRLAHHSIGIDSYDFSKNIAWLVAKQWIPLQSFLNS